MILIYTPKITSRITYITRYIFEDILKVTVEITDNLDEFKVYQGPKINYSFEYTDAIRIFPHPFLLKQEVSPVEVEVIRDNGIPLLFPQEGESDFKFDPFSAAFYMISRYEEYLIKDRDEHGRFKASSSLAFKHKFNEMPVVNYWADMLKECLEYKYPWYVFPPLKFQFIPSIDVDIAYAYRGRSLLRTLASAAYNIFNIQDQIQRWNTLILGKPDPFDTFGLFREWHKKYTLDTLYFIHVGKYGGHDRCISPNNPLMSKLIKEISSEYEVGIHPSYGSNSQLPVIKDEMETLATVSGKSVSRSRQHFLRFDITKTYPVLIECGIKEEYSMGWAEMPGFRAGTCTPFNFYNVNKEEETGLKVYPFTFMDGNWIHYMNSNPDLAVDEIGKLVDTVKKVNGTLITIWHNLSISEIKIWKGWRNIYPTMLTLITK